MKWLKKDNKNDFSPYEEILLWNEEVEKIKNFVSQNPGIGKKLMKIVEADTAPEVLYWRLSPSEGRGIVKAIEALNKIFNI